MRYDFRRWRLFVRYSNVSRATCWSTKPSREKIKAKPTDFCPMPGRLSHRINTIINTQCIYFRQVHKEYINSKENNKWTKTRV